MKEVRLTSNGLGNQWKPLPRHEHFPSGGIYGSQPRGFQPLFFFLKWFGWLSNHSWLAENPYCFPDLLLTGGFWWFGPTLKIGAIPKILARRRRTFLRFLPSSNAVLPLQFHVLVRLRRNFWAYCPDLAKSHISDSGDLLTRRVFDKGGGFGYKQEWYFLRIFVSFSNSYVPILFSLWVFRFLLLFSNIVSKFSAGGLLVLLMVLFVAALSSPWRGRRGFVYVFSYLR